MEKKLIQTDENVKTPYGLRGGWATPNCDL